MMDKRDPHDPLRATMLEVAEAEASRLRRLHKDALDEVGILRDEAEQLTAEIEQLRKRLKSLAYIPYRVTDLPVILEVMAYNGVHWQECSNCREELTTDTRDNGVRLACGQCGAEWWEGELIKSESTKGNDRPNPAFKHMGIDEQKFREATAPPSDKDCGHAPHLWVDEKTCRCGKSTSKIVPEKITGKYGEPRKYRVEDCPHDAQKESGDDYFCEDCGLRSDGADA